MLKKICLKKKKLRETRIFKGSTNGIISNQGKTKQSWNITISRRGPGTQGNPLS
jgi:hypothetical protein